MVKGIEMNRREVLVIAGLASFAPIIFRNSQPTAGLIIGDGMHGEGSAAFELRHHPAGQGFQAQFFRNGELAAQADLPPDVTLGEVRALADQWFSAFDPECADA